jgi:lysophospholipase L1-like esterase
MCSVCNDEVEQMKIQPDSTILFQGDSITDAGRKRDFGDCAIPANNDMALGRGYASKVASRLLADQPGGELAFHNRGVSGNRVTNMRDRWQADCFDLNPDVLSILIGVNDTWHGVAKGTPENGVDLEPFDQILRELLATTREALPDTQIVLCEPFTTEAGAVLSMNFHPDIDERRALVQQIAADEKLILVPFQGMFDDLCKKAPAAYWAGDGVHPTMAGHEMMARCWLDTVANA